MNDNEFKKYYNSRECSFCDKKDYTTCVKYYTNKNIYYKRICHDCTTSKVYTCPICQCTFDGLTCLMNNIDIIDHFAMYHQSNNYNREFLTGISCNSYDVKNMLENMHKTRYDFRYGDVEHSVSHIK